MNENVSKGLKTMFLGIISAVVSFITALLTNGGIN